MDLTWRLETLTNTFLLALEVRDQLGDELTGLEGLEVTGLLWLIIHYHGPEW